jgi:hypothetical protein
MLIEFDTGAHEPIQHGCFTEAIVPTDIAPTEVVGHDEQDIGFALVFGTLCSIAGKERQHCYAAEEQKLGRVAKRTFLQ